MGCVIPIFQNSDKATKQYVSFKDESNEIFEYTPPRNLAKQKIVGNSHNIESSPCENDDDNLNESKINISSVSGIDIEELLSLHNSFQLNPDKTIVFDQEETNVLQSLQDELNCENHPSLNVSFTFM